MIENQDKKSLSTFDETKSTNSVKVIEVKEVSENKNQIVLEEGRGDLEIKNHADQPDNDNNQKEEEGKDKAQTITETADILSLEEILCRELEKFSTAGVCWHLEREKKRTLCMFFVRYQSSYLMHFSFNLEIFWTSSDFFWDKLNDIFPYLVLAPDHQKLKMF